MTYPKGKPALKFVIHRPSGQSDYTILIAQGFPTEGSWNPVTKTFSIGDIYSDFGEEYVPDFITHELDGIIKRKLLGFWYHAHITFEGLSGELVHHLRFIMDRNAHTGIDFYPSYVSHPNYKEQVTIDDDSIKFFYHNIRLPVLKDFEMKLIGTERRSAVPELSSTFRSWTNEHLLFSEIPESYSELE
jgi:hypothetical protein